MDFELRASASPVASAWRCRPGRTSGHPRPLALPGKGGRSLCGAATTAGAAFHGGLDIWSLRQATRRRPHLSQPAAPSQQHLHHPSRRRSTIRDAQSGRALDDDSVDVAVFRFTLGIPGFEDRLIPRVVGLLGAALLVVNHVFGAQPVPDAQGRAEVAVLALAAMSVLVPEVEARLKEALPGRGRQHLADRVEGATNGFALAPDLPDTLKQELAWASASLIKNTNSCAVLLVREGRALLARGALAVVAFDPQQQQQQPKAVLERVSQGLQPLAPLLATGAPVAVTAEAAAGKVGQQQQQQQQQAADSIDAAQRRQQYFADRSAMDGSSALAACSSIVPKGAQSLLLQPLSGQGAQQSYLLLYSERPRALSDRERRWAAALSVKLAN